MQKIEKRDDHKYKYVYNDMHVSPTSCRILRRRSAASRSDNASKSSEVSFAEYPTLRLIFLIFPLYTLEKQDLQRKNELYAPNLSRKRSRTNRKNGDQKKATHHTTRTTGKRLLYTHTQRSPFASSGVCQQFLLTHARRPSCDDHVVHIPL